MEPDQRIRVRCLQARRERGRLKRQPALQQLQPGLIAAVDGGEEPVKQDVSQQHRLPRLVQQVHRGVRVRDRATDIERQAEPDKLGVDRSAERRIIPGSRQRIL